MLTRAVQLLQDWDFAESIKEKKMIYSLNGTLIHIDPQSVVIECGGVGYKCYVTSQTLGSLPNIGEKARLYTYMSVREDGVELFGFSAEDELSSFKLLIGVNGVGPKAALAILSELSPSKLAIAVSSGDIKSLTRAQGVGNKTAQRIALELKDKFSSLGVSQDDSESPQFADVPRGSDNLSQAVAALVNLGYSQSEAQSAISKCNAAADVGDIIKDALKYLF